MLGIPKFKNCLGRGCFPWVHAVCQVAIQCPNLHITPDIYIFIKYPGVIDYIIIFYRSNLYLTPRILDYYLK